MELPVPGMCCEWMSPAPWKGSDRKEQNWESVQTRAPRQKQKKRASKLKDGLGQGAQFGSDIKISKIYVSSLNSKPNPLLFVCFIQLNLCLKKWNLTYVFLKYRSVAGAGYKFPQNWYVFWWQFMSPRKRQNVLRSMSLDEIIWQGSPFFSLLSSSNALTEYAYFGGLYWGVIIHLPSVEKKRWKYFIFSPHFSSTSPFFLYKSM